MLRLVLPRPSSSSPRFVSRHSFYSVEMPLEGASQSVGRIAFDMTKQDRSPIKQIPEMTLNQLEGVSPGGPFTTYLTERLAQARSAPVGSLGPSDVRLLLSQRQGTTYVVPRALELLEGDPWIVATFYPGDLLKALLNLERMDWPPGSEWPQRIEAVAQAAQERMYELPADRRNPEVVALVSRWLQSVQE